MNPLRNNRITHFAVLCGMLLLGAGTQAALADPLVISVLAPGVQTPAGISTYYENFDKVTPSGGTLTTNFSGSSITGTYTGDFSIMAADAFGGAGGSHFISTSGNKGSYTLTLNTPVNYFGMWFSALDSGNNLSFYNGKALVDTFTPADFVALVGACPASTNPYCGNPNNHLDATEQFAFLNFYNPKGTFDKIIFDQDSGSGAQFESDNQTVASLSAPPTGSDPGVVPEPASLFLFGTGFLGAAVLFRRQLLPITSHRADTSIA